MAGLIHRNKGKPSPRKIQKVILKRIIELARGRLKDINDTHLSEILLREEQIRISRQGLRRMLRGAGIPAKRKRRSPKHRSRRERKEAFGMMLQIDGSPHDWLEGRGPRLTLLGAQDDATSLVWARFEEAETTWGYMTLLREICLSKGLPLSPYSDRHTIFHSPKEPTLVEQINEDATRVLEWFLKEYNRRFCVPAKKQEPVFQNSPTPLRLDRVLCLKETRTVNQEHTVSFEGLP